MQFVIVKNHHKLKVSECRQKLSVVYGLYLLITGVGKKKYKLPKIAKHDTWWNLFTHPQIGLVKHFIYLRLFGLPFCDFYFYFHSYLCGGWVQLCLGSVLGVDAER